MSKPQRCGSTCPLEDDTNVTGSPVRGAVGENEKEATGAAGAAGGVASQIVSATTATAYLTAVARVARGIVAPPRGCESTYWTNVGGGFFPPARLRHVGEDLHVVAAVVAAAAGVSGSDPGEAGAQDVLAMHGAVHPLPARCPHRLIARRDVLPHDHVAALGVALDAVDRTIAGGVPVVEEALGQHAACVPAGSTIEHFVVLQRPQAVSLALAVCAVTDPGLYGRGRARRGVCVEG